LLMRTVDRAERIYGAMSARGFTGEYYIGKENKLKTQDIIYFLGWTAYFLFVRYYNVAEFMGALINK
jgi:cobalt/nickel transport system permease protein